MGFEPAQFTSWLRLTWFGTSENVRVTERGRSVVEAKFRAGQQGPYDLLHALSKANNVAFGI